MAFMSRFNPPPMPGPPSPNPQKTFEKLRKFVLLMALPALLMTGILASQKTDSKSKSGSNSNSSSASTNVLISNVQCISIPSNVLSDIASGEEAGVGMIPVVGYAVKSPDFSNVYFLAVKFSATGIDDQIGVWARNGINSGVIMSVDPIAQNFTVWPDADSADAAIASNDPNVKSAKSCL